MSERRALRVSLTKLQRQTAAGIELMALCREVTADGLLSDADIADLRGWIDAFAEVPMPARGYLDITLRHVLADGVISADERREVQLAVEKVLPPDLRREIVARRQCRANLDIVENGPLQGWDFMVAGCRYEGRPGVIEAECRIDERVYLVRESSNQYDGNAIEVRLRSGSAIGYVPRADAADMAPMLDTDHPYQAYIKKILTGGRSPIPVVVADFFPHTTNVGGLSRRQHAPERRGCATGAAMLVFSTAAVLGQSLLR